jgi:PTS system mannose-specific IIA component
MVNILLISHGSFCEGLLASLEMIAGSQENIQALQYHPGQSPDDYRSQIDEALNTLSGETIVLCDLKGGTPYNSALYLKNKYDFKLITGMNLPVLISIVTSRTTDTTADDLAKIALAPENAGIELSELSKNGGRTHGKLSLNKN